VSSETGWLARIGGGSIRRDDSRDRVPVLYWYACIRNRYLHCKDTAQNAPGTGYPHGDLCGTYSLTLIVPYTGTTKDCDDAIRPILPVHINNA